MPTCNYCFVHCTAVTLWHIWHVHMWVPLPAHCCGGVHNCICFSNFLHVFTHCQVWQWTKLVYSVPACHQHFTCRNRYENAYYIFLNIVFMIVIYCTMWWWCTCPYIHCFVHAFFFFEPLSIGPDIYFEIYWMGTIKSFNKILWSLELCVLSCTGSICMVECVCAYDVLVVGCHCSVLTSNKNCSWLRQCVFGC